MMEKNKLIVTSFNCKNVKTSIHDIMQMCETSDVLLLQETWLMDFDLAFLSTIHPDFSATGISSMDSSAGVLAGRPHGGMAIMWRRSLADKCKIVSYDDTRLLGIEFSAKSYHILFINVYLPHNCASNSDDYLFYLAKIQNIIQNAATPYVFAIGDFNGDLSASAQHVQGRELQRFCETEGYLLSDISLLSSDSFTFYSSAHASVSWLDHILTNKNGHAKITNINIDYSKLSSDHFPMHLKLDIETDQLPDDNAKVPTYKRINWGKLKEDEIKMYHNATTKLLNHIDIDHGLMLCTDTTCTDPAHTCAINRMYSDIINTLTEASELLQPKHREYRQVPGWDVYLKEAHNAAREHFLQWVAHNKPKYGTISDAMRTSRAYFKMILRQCLQSDSKAKCDALAIQYLSKDIKQFWSTVQSMRDKKPPISNTIDGVTGQNNIAAFWQKNFKELLNSNDNSHQIEHIMNEINSTSLSFSHFSTKDTLQCILKLKCGISSGIDGISSEHFRFADRKIVCLLTMFLNACVVHSFFPADMMKTVLIPLVKDTNENISSSDNYRPIAIATVSSKLYENLLLTRIGNFLSTTDNQFGFKAKHSTDMAVYSLKYVTEYYVSQSSPVYTCYIDASKAFDRVDYWMLFKKLLKRGIPPVLVRSLVFWNTNQEFMVKWGNCISTSFTVLNGLRQGGILSSHMYNVYIDDLSKQLADSNVGCYINDVCTNHFIYADDTVIVAPSPLALQELLDICESYARQHSIVFNVKKTKLMCIKPKAYSDLIVPTFRLDNKEIKCIKKHKYLGCIIREDMSDDDDIRRQMRSVYAKGNGVINKFKLCSPIVKTQLFRAYCSHFYCSTTWANYRNPIMNKLSVAYKTVFRNFFNVSTGTCSTTQKMLLYNCDPMPVILRKLLFSFRKRLLCSRNNVLQAILQSSFYHDCSMTKEWSKLLFV